MKCPTAALKVYTYSVLYQPLVPLSSSSPYSYWCSDSKHTTSPIFC